MDAERKKERMENKEKRERVVKSGREWEGVFNLSLSPDTLCVCV